jgi:hypothetical protein
MANLNFSSILSPDHLAIQTLSELIDGQADQSANNLYANASYITLGNSSVYTYITPDTISSTTIVVGDSASNSTINSTAFNLLSYGGNTYIDAYLAQLSGVVIAQKGIYIDNILSLNGLLVSNNSSGNVGDIFTRSETGDYWSDSANNSLNLDGVPAALYVNTSGSYSISGLHNYISNVQFITGNSTVVNSSTNSTMVSFGNSSINATMTANATNIFFTGVSYTSNNSVNLGGFAADQYAYSNVIPTLQTKAALSADVHNLTANNSDYLNGVIGSDYLTKFGNFTITGIHNHTANVQLRGAFVANGNAGTLGQVLASDSNGNVFWRTTNGQSISVANLVVTGAITANSFTGEKGLVLTSNGGGGIYWSDVTNVSGGVFDGGSPLSSYINNPRLDAGGVY